MNAETGSMRRNAFEFLTVIICMALMIGCASTSKGMVSIEKMEQLTLGMHVKEIRTLLGSPATISHAQTATQAPPLNEAVSGLRSELGLSPSSPLRFPCSSV